MQYCRKTLQQQRFAICTQFNTSQSNIIRKRHFPINVKFIKNSAFYNCVKLQEAQLHSYVLEIGDGAFCMCKALKNINLPNSIVNIKSYAFAASGLETIILPNELKSIEPMVFAQCYYLNEVILPDTLTTIGAEAFAYCHSLSNITIPQSVIEIGNAAFRHCRNLKDIYI